MKYLATIALLIWSFTIQGQEYPFRGIVQNQEGHPVGFASIQYVGKGISADKDGKFHLQLQRGSYKLTISAIGYQTRSTTVDIPEVSTVAITLKDSTQELTEVVVTATRTSRALDDVPMPVSVIQKKQIEQMSSIRLNEVLQEQTGLQITSNHGTGVQMQGLTSDYILFLIDGEPLIGRTAGTLELTRLAVDNIERVEIIKGPSSSLYGSEAMAGVVNIITRAPYRGFSGSVRSRFRSYATSDLSGSAGFNNDRLNASLFADRIATNGYDLNKETISMTAPPYEAYTLQPKFSYRFSKKLLYKISTRFYTEEQHNQSDIIVEDETKRVKETGKRHDWNLMPELNLRINDRHQLQFRNYTTGYKTTTVMKFSDDSGVYDESFFDQLFNRSEIQYDWYLNDSRIVTAGIGHTIETVEATRYDDVNDFQANYGFLQYQWKVTPSFDVIAGGRFDTHSEYASRFSPKLAIGYRINQHLKIQGSVGGGYKAPDFRQLLLNFTNPVAGYTVAGSSIVQDVMARLQAEGEIATVFIDPATIGTIEAESSLAYNAGLQWEPSNEISFKLNGFRNNIHQLIDTAPIARKTNGQNVFSYFNFDEVVTQGIEFNGSYQPFDALLLSVGYQYLDSRNVGDLEKIKNGELFRRNPETNQTEAVTRADYGGLPQRSRHSGNAKIFYGNQPLQFDISLRAIYRGKWGLGDNNGNGVIDTASEYGKGYLLLNLSANKNISDWLTLEMGSNNLTNVTNINEPSLAGRVWFAGVHLNLNQLFTTTND